MFREVVGRAQKLAQKEGARSRGMRFHDLRHEMAIRYLESGGSIYTLKKILGHGTIKQTEEYLDYLTPEQAAIVTAGRHKVGHLQRFPPLLCSEMAEICAFGWVAEWFKAAVLKTAYRLTPDNQDCVSEAKGS
jgi:hypothetical protein